MDWRISVSWNVGEAKRNMNALVLWLKALEEEGADCEQDYKSIETIRKLLNEIEERHGDRLVQEMRERYDNQGGHEHE